MTNFIIQFKFFTQARKDGRRPSIFAKRFGRVPECSGRKIEFLKAYCNDIWVVRSFIYVMKACQSRQHRVSTSDADTHPLCCPILRE